MVKSKTKFHSCTKMRRMLITHSVLTFNTANVQELGSEWVTQACGVPLFNDAERETGICKSCAKGWTHENNYPVDE